jgi:hypothetical protein
MASTSALPVAALSSSPSSSSWASSSSDATTRRSASSSALATTAQFLSNPSHPPPRHPALSMTTGLRLSPRTPHLRPSHR